MDIGIIKWEKPATKEELVEARKIINSLAPEILNELTAFFCKRSLSILPDTRENLEKAGITQNGQIIPHVKQVLKQLIFRSLAAGIAA